MSEADRIVRERAAALRRNAEQAARDNANRAFEARDRSIAAIRELAPQAVAALERRGFPDAELVRVRRAFGATERAGWPVASVEVPYGEASRVVYCYLLSDGRFVLARVMAAPLTSTRCRDGSGSNASRLA
jgi:hypothetical protein